MTQGICKRPDQSAFNLIGQTSPKLGITQPTFEDVYSYTIGDIIQYGSGYYYSCESGEYDTEL